jgi:hypothetical protein
MLLGSDRHKLSGRVAASRPKALAMADGRTIAKLRLTLPPAQRETQAVGMLTAVCGVAVPEYVRWIAA